MFLSDGLFKQSEKTFQHRLAVPILTVDAKGNLRQVGDGNVAQIRFSGCLDIRIQRIAHFCFDKSQSALDGFVEETILRREGGQDIAVDTEDGIGNLAGRAGDEIAFQLCSGQSPVLRQRMIGGTDAGEGDRTDFMKRKGNLFGLFPNPPERPESDG